MLVISGSKGNKSDDAQTWKVLFGILICKYKTTRAFLLLDDLERNLSFCFHDSHCEYIITYLLYTDEKDEDLNNIIFGDKR